MFRVYLHDAPSLFSSPWVMSIFLSFYLFSPSGPLCPLQAFLWFCHLRVQLSLLFFFLSLCTLFSSRSLFYLSFYVVCVCSREEWLIHWVRVRGRGYNPPESEEYLRKSRVFKIIDFNREYQQMQKFKK